MFPAGKLGDLADSSKFHDALMIDGVLGARAVEFLRMMSFIRAVEFKLADERRNGSIGGPVHLSVGQEAVAVGISTVTRAGDMIFGAHRSHAHVLALGSDVRSLFAEVLGRDTGLSRGMGGSMHLIDVANGFFGAVPIVAGSIGLAVGAGLAAKLRAAGAVAISYLGDGAAEEGVFHEALNFSKINNIPILFVVENNLFSSHMHISDRQPADSIARFAIANNVPARVVDGNNVFAVASAAKDLVSQSRLGGGPGLIEAVTYRWLGHVDWREDVDVGVNRSQSDLAEWKGRDPIDRLRRGLVSAGVWSASSDQLMESEIRHQIETAWCAALDDPYPSTDKLLARVFFQK